MDPRLQAFLIVMGIALLVLAALGICYWFVVQTDKAEREYRERKCCETS